MKFFLSFAALIACATASEYSLSHDEGKLTLRHGESEILTYHTAEMAPPESAGANFRRSGFIHPVKTPGGGVLTGIHPADHYHHMGLWHAWVKTEHGLDHPDFWNIGKGKARVRFQKILKTVEEKDKVGFTVAQEQVALKGDSKQETVVLREEFTVTASGKDGLNVIDYSVTQTNVSGVALVMPAYRYGGPLAYRGPHTWNQANSEYLTSEGKTRKDSHATRAKWCAVFGPTAVGEGTLAFLCHPKNHDAPQRLRTWPDGKMFLNWAPAQETGFTIHAGDAITWNYRLLAGDGKISAEKIDAEWQAWAGEKSD